MPLSIDASNKKLEDTAYNMHCSEDKSMLRIHRVKIAKVNKNFVYVELLFNALQ